MKKLAQLITLLFATELVFGATDLILPKNLRNELQQVVHQSCGWNLTELRHIKTIRERLPAGIQGVYDLEYTSTIEATLGEKKTILMITQTIYDHGKPYQRNNRSYISRFSDKNGLCK
jgi:hypothetical protein